MDFKLPTSTREKSFWKEHKEFLAISTKTKNIKKLWVKMTITENTNENELLKAIKLIKSFKRNIEVFLQPVSRINNINPPSEKSLLQIQCELLKQYPHIRVIPQVHKMMGQK